MNKPSRRSTLLITGLAVLALVLLAGSLTDLELLPGRYWIEDDLPQPEITPGTLPPNEFLGQVIQAMAILMAVTLPFAIIYIIISPDARKQVIGMILRVALFLLLAYLLTAGPTKLLQPKEFNAEPNLSPIEAPLIGEPMPEFTGEVSSNLVFFLSVGVAAILTLMILGGAWALLRREPEGDETLDQLAEEARQALKTLQGGGDLKNAVIRCYVEMSRVIREQRNIHLERAMTTREFEARLIHAGLPERAVRELTRLFEDVRYGTREPGANEEQKAVACLTAIAEAAGGPAQ